MTFEGNHSLRALSATNYSTQRGMEHPDSVLALFPGPFPVKREQVLEDILVRDVLRPPIGREERPIESFVRVLQPRGAVVVQLRERAPL